MAPPAQRYVIGLSGGLDSTCLTHAMDRLVTAGKLLQPLLALHVNHGLHPDADSWQQSCAAFCKRMGVAFTARRVSVNAGGSLEKAARDARYTAFEDVLEPGDMLLLAHHRDDQLETFLLRLMRGAGPESLGGMPQLRAVGPAVLYRPLLSFSRCELVEYATGARLNWVKDSSNMQLQHDRNYLRHRVLPLIAERWPAYQAAWSKSLQLLDEAATGLIDLTQEDLQQLNAGEGRLALAALEKLPLFRVRNAVQHWIGLAGLPRPGWHSLQRLEQVLTGCGQNKLVHECAQYRLQTFDGYLWLLRSALCFNPLIPVRLPVNPAAESEIMLPENGRLTISCQTGQGLSRSLFDRSEAGIRYRQGGEAIRLPGRPRKSLKKLLQEQRIPPWVRERLPLLYLGNELVCVPGIGIAEGCCAQQHEPGLIFDWQPPVFGFEPDAG